MITTLWLKSGVCFSAGGALSNGVSLREIQEEI